VARPGRVARVVASRHRGTALACVLSAAPFLAVLDANVVAIALPSIGDDLGFSQSSLSWVVTAYGLAFGGGLLVAGRAADLYGRRRLLIAGLGLFSVASLASAAAPSRPALLATRIAQGLGAAMAFPASLALIGALFDRGEQRHRALGVYGALASTAFVSGMVGGGLIAASFGWRGTVALGCPFGAAAALATARLVPEVISVEPRPPPALPAVLAAAVGAVVVLYGLGLAIRPGDRAAAAVVLASALVLVVVAVQLERRSASPLVPPGLVRGTEVRCAILAALATVGTGVGAVFFLTLYLQEVLEYGPFVAGLILTPIGVAGVSGGLLVHRLARRAGLVPAVAAALIVQAAGVALLTAIGTTTGIVVVLVGSATLGFGHFAATVAFTALATTGRSDADHGIAMGLVGSAQQVGGALGLAVLVAIAAARTSAGDAPGSREAVVDGFQWALGAGAALSLAGAGLILAVSRRSDRARRRRPPSGWETTHSRER